MTTRQQVAWMALGLVMLMAALAFAADDWSPPASFHRAAWFLRTAGYMIILGLGGLILRRLLTNSWSRLALLLFGVINLSLALLNLFVVLALVKQEYG